MFDCKYNTIKYYLSIPTNPSKEVRSARRVIIRKAYKLLLSKLNGRNFIRNDFLNENVYIIWKENFRKHDVWISKKAARQRIAMSN